jgi:hypothetical protein
MATGRPCASRSWRHWFYELPEGYGESGLGRLGAPFPKIIGSKVLMKKPGWEEAAVDEVVARVGPRSLDDGKRGAVYKVSRIVLRASGRRDPI